MSPAAPLLTELYLSLATLIGLIAVHRMLTSADPDEPITRRFLFGIRVTLMLFAGRALAILLGSDWLYLLVHLGAALVPLAVLLLTEGLLRRHAPRWLKWLAAGGAALFVVLAPLPAGWIDPARLGGLLAYQVAIFSAAGWMIWTRDRTSLNTAENLTVSRLALSLILLIPLIAGDFLMETLGLPVRLSPLGVLTLCWLAVGLNRPGGARLMILGFCGLLALALASGVLIATASQTGWDGVVLFGVITLAALLVIAVLQDARSGQAASQHLGLLTYLARAPAPDAMSFLRGLQSHPTVDGAALIDDRALADLDPQVLDRVLARQPVLRRSDPARPDPVEQEHIDHLFERFAASHIMAISLQPRRLVALAMPALAASPQSEMELETVQRMAALMMQTEALSQPSEAAWDRKSDR